MVFIFQFVNMVYHIDWFAYIEESLHPWNKPNLIMVYELFDVLPSSIYQKVFRSLTEVVGECSLCVIGISSKDDVISVRS